MARLISVSEEVYGMLTEMKKDESYSKVIMKLAAAESNKDKILKFFGKGGIDEKMVKELAGLWKRWSEKYA